MKRETFSPAQAQQVATAFGKHQVDYMFIGKSGAILLGYPGTTQDVDVFPRKDAENGRRIVAALSELGFIIDSVLEAKARIDMSSGFPVANISDIIESKRAAKRPRDAVELPLLQAFREMYEKK